MQRSVKWISNVNGGLIAKHSLLVLTTCDEKYFHFAKSLAKSMDFFSPDYLLCIHIINPSIDLFRTIKNEKLDSNLIISCEKTDLSEFSEEEKRAYYASARFFRIPELMQEFNVDIFCVDSDSLIVNPIDGDFTNKDEADISLVRRDTVNGKINHIASEPPLEMKVATGSILSRNRKSTLEFYSELNKTLTQKFIDRQLSWFIDQVIFYETMMKLQAKVTVRGIKTKYADWNFKASSILWAGKGELKNTNFKFLTLQKLLSEDEYTRYEHLSLAHKLVGSDDLVSSDIYPKIEKITSGFKKKIAIFLPRLDLPWKKPTSDKPPLISKEATELRSFWKKICIYISNSFEREGFIVETIEIPAWEITELKLNFSDCSLAFIPHRCNIDFDITKVKIPVYFYMQEYFSWMFTIDSDGWSAASSIYPVKYNKIPDIDNDKYNSYLNKLNSGELESKFLQTKSSGVKSLVESGQIPRHSDPRVSHKRFIFFPLQIPHDQSIRYFSKLTEERVIRRLLIWSKENDIPIVFKPHPASPKSMEPLIEIIRDGGGYIAEANIHDLIELSYAVYTINSGVGFEALFHNKPIVTFGRAEYDCCTFKATMNNLDFAWVYCILSSRNDLRKGYAKFFNWFSTEYAYDLSDAENTSTKLRMLAKRIKKKHFATMENF